MSWRHLDEPLLPWITTLDRVLAAARPRSISGPTLVIAASDFGGSNKQSRYRTYVHLCLDLDTCQRWHLQRATVRAQHLSDGRRMSYKALNDVLRRRALEPFLSAAETLSGVCVALIVDKRLGHLCFNTPEDYRQMHRAAAFRARWKDKELEEALRVTHVVGALVGGLSHPSQNVYWFVDEDNMFANERQANDVARMLSSWSSHYARYRLGELAIGTAGMLDEGDRWEEDLTAIPDLAAGALADSTTRLSEKCGGYIPRTVAVPFDDPLPAKTRLIADWFWSHGPTLRRVALLFALQKDGRYAVSRHEMQAG